MPQLSITQLPQAGALTGSEPVPIVQNGVTVQTTTGAIAVQPTQTQTFLTVNQELSLQNSRYLSTNTGLSLTDGGAESYYKIGLTGAVGQLNGLSGGIVVKNGANTIVARSIATSGGGLSVSNADGTGGNPTLQLSGLVASFANIGIATGLVAIQDGTTAVSVNLYGTTNQIDVTNGNGVGNPTFGISANPILPGTGAVTLPLGTNSQKPSGSSGQMRYNTDTQVFEGYASGTWKPFSLSGGVTSFSAGSTGFTPSTDTSGVVTLAGTLNVSNGGTGATTLTGYVKGSGTSAMTASSTIPNTDVSGLGTMSTQNSNAVAITGGSTSGVAISGGSINNTPIGATVPSTGAFTNIAVTTGTISTTPATGNDIVNKAYVDNATSASLDIHPAVVDDIDGNVSATYVQGGTTPTWTTITTNNTVATGSAHGLAVNDMIVFSSTANGLTSGTAYFVYSVPTTTSVTLSLSYNGVQITSLTNGTGLTIGSLCNSGVGATLTSTANGPLTYEGYTFALNDRVLFIGQTSAFQNGVYTITQVGVTSVSPWIATRATDGNKYIPNSASGLDAGSYFLVTGGSDAGEAYVLSTAGVIIIGTTNIAFSLFSQVTPYTAGTGLTLSSNQFSITNTGVTAATYGSASSVPVLSVNAQGQLTTVTNTAIAIASGAVSGLAASATTDTTNATNITSGTLPAARLSGSYTGITGVGTLTVGTWNGTAVGVAYGGTGLTATPTNGQLAIGNGTGYTLATLTAGTNVSISNTSGGITISATPSAGGTVTSVAMTVPNFLSVTGSPITTSGTLAVTLSGTALPVSNGGSGATTLTGYLIGNGTSAFTASTTIPNSAITGLGTMSTQAASSVTITGGTINGTSIGATTVSTGAFTTISASGVITSTLATGTAPFTVASTTQVANLNAATAGATTNVGITAASTGATNYLTFVTATSGNLPQLVNSSITANAVTGAITGGIFGGAF